MRENREFLNGFRAEIHTRSACIRRSALGALALGSLASSSAQELEADVDTLLLLHANGSLAGEGGEMPVEASGITFEGGVHGQGVRVDNVDLLSYASAGELDSGQGTVEFWIRPNWNGVDGTTRAFFALGSELWLEKDGADNLVFIIRLPDSEAFQAFSLTAWNAREWHHVAATWEIPGSMRVYVDGFERVAHPAFGQDLIPVLPALLSIGSKTSAFQADAVFDEIRISGRARSASEIARSFLAGLEIQSLALEPIASTMFPTWRQTARLTVQTSTGPLELPPGAATWSSSEPAVAEVDGLGEVRALAPGSFELLATVGTLQSVASIDVAAPTRLPERGEVAPDLGEPAPGHLHGVPVLVIRYLPTVDGVNLDTSFDPDFFDLHPLTLDELSADIEVFDRRVKFMLEEGSRFRGYRDPLAPPSLGYRVVDVITVYEPTPPGKVQAVVQGLPLYLPDFHSIFERFGVEDLVNDHGVQEIWFWTGGVTPDFPSYDPTLHTPEKLRNGWESNMSSPTSGDVSNSDRDPYDLPVYERTYVLYGNNFRRTQAEAVHNHGHQLEAILSHVNERQDGDTELFWQRFVGRDASFAWVQGRCGDTHHPPNASTDYDYTNPTPVESDIADWDPDGTGARALVNADTWGDVAYPWPGGAPAEQRVESQWYVYWMQSMPGHANGISFGDEALTNWWRFTADWDASLAAGLGLHGPQLPPGVTYALVAERLVRLDRPGLSSDAVHSNGDVELRRGDDTVLACDLFAVDDVRVRSGNTVAGAITAGDEVELEDGAEVEGAIVEHAALAPLVIPRPSFAAGGEDIVVERGGLLDLAPGSYGRVLVRRSGVLGLQGGTYSFQQLLTERDAVLSCDVSLGTVALHAAERLAIDARVRMLTSFDEPGSPSVEIVTLQRSPLRIGEGASLSGTLIAPDAAVTLRREADFHGTIWADSIEVERGARFRAQPE